MDFNDYKTGKDDVSRRLDKVIRIFAEQLSLPEIYKAIRKGLIKVNNHKTKSDYRIQENDVISIASFLVNKADNNTCIKNVSKNISMPEIIFENEYILILNKPYDVNVHGDEKSLDKVVAEYYNSKHHNDSLSFKPGPIHRLDKKTTGLIAFSMNLQGAHWFSENIKNHIIQKKYWGLVEGALDKTENWQDNITKIDKVENENSFHTVNAETDGDGVHAETIATPLAHGTLQGHKVTLVQFHIKTGRKHQIRAQSGLHNHPLLGDTVYGGHKPLPGNQMIYLTAKELNFPKNNPLNLPEKITISIPSAFKKILKSCGIEKIDV